MARSPYRMESSPRSAILISTVDLKIADLGDDSILYGDLAMIKGLK